MGKVHGGLAKVGKVRNQTPKVDKTPKAKPLRGRAKKRLLYNRRFISALVGPGGKKMGPNSQARFR